MDNLRNSDAPGRSSQNIQRVNIFSTRTLAHGSLDDTSPKEIYSPKQQVYAQLSELLISSKIGAAVTVDLHIVTPTGSVAGNAHRVQAAMDVDDGPIFLQTLIDPQWKVYLSSAAGTDINYHLSGVEIF